MAGRFPLYADADVRGPFIKALKNAGWDVVRAIDELIEGTDDPPHFERAVEQGRVLVSNDSDQEDIAHLVRRTPRLPRPHRAATGGVSHDDHQGASRGIRGARATGRSLHSVPDCAHLAQALKRSLPGIRLPPEHPFLSAEYETFYKQAEVMAILEESSSVEDFIARLQEAGFRVQEDEY